MLDWRDDPAIPRDGYFAKRNQAFTGIIIHNTGGMESIEQDNDYHRHKDWGDGVRAPHIAYHFWLPYNWDVFLADRGLLPDELPDCVIVQANYLWEAAWHAGSANQSCVGIACQLNGETQELSENQRRGIAYLVDYLEVPKQHTYGHREYPGNATVCPGAKVMGWLRAFRKESI